MPPQLGDAFTVLFGNARGGLSFPEIAGMTVGQERVLSLLDWLDDDAPASWEREAASPFGDPEFAAAYDALIARKLSEDERLLINWVDTQVAVRYRAPAETSAGSVARGAARALILGAVLPDNDFLALTAPVNDLRRRAGAGSLTLTL